MGNLSAFCLCALILVSFLGHGGASDGEIAESAGGDCDCRGVVCPETVGEDKCPHGLVTDTRGPCSCCSRCGKGEYEYCDPEPKAGGGGKGHGEKHVYGRCGRRLACGANYGVTSGDRPEMICFCQNEKMVCGNDGVTYETECLMQKVAFESGQSIGRERKGMCKGGPKVVTLPVDVTNSTVGNVYLQCEVMGNPVPRVEWRKLVPGGPPGPFLPHDNDRMTVQTRGGPEEYEVTGWLQIARLELDDAGQYECVGINKFGQDSGRAQIAVVENTRAHPAQ